VKQNCRTKAEDVESSRSRCWQRCRFSPRPARSDAYLLAGYGAEINRSKAARCCLLSARWRATAGYGNRIRVCLVGWFVSWVRFGSVRSIKFA